MPIDPSDFLRCLNEPFMAVRAYDGTLVGCIPRPSNTMGDGLRGTDGRGHLFYWAASLCVRLDQDANLERVPLEGFIPLTGVQPHTDAKHRYPIQDPDLALPPTASEP